MQANEIIPPHEVTDQTKLDKLVADMQSRGWQGAPIVLVDDLALCGSHRIEAARIAGIEVPTVQATDLWPEIENEIITAFEDWDTEIALVEITAMILNVDSSAQATYGLDLE